MKNSTIFEEIEARETRLGMSYEIMSNSSANLDTTLDEWIRFLSYFKPDELSFLERLDAKELSELTESEIQKCLKLREQKELLDLLKKYKNKTCTKEEHDRVLEYINGSLKSFMKSRLTRSEKEKAKERIAFYKEKTSKQLGEYIDSQMEHYDTLSLLDAYVLYQVRDLKQKKDNDEAIKEIVKGQKERAYYLRKALRRDFGI